MTAATDYRQPPNFDEGIGKVPAVTPGFWIAEILADADAKPEALYPTGDGTFEFARTVSRLEELQSADYLAEGHGAA